MGIVDEALSDNAPETGIMDEAFASTKKKRGIVDEALAGAKYVGGAIVGAGEIAANLATQTYGLPVRGYGEIANLVTGRTDLADKASKALIYEPQTEQGREGMDAIGKAFDWWHEKSMAVGEPVREVIGKQFGETAGNVAGATVASTMEAAPLLLGEVYGKAKSGIAERRASSDRAVMADMLAREREANLSRADLGEVIPEDPITARGARESATRQYGEEVAGNIQRGYLGEEVAKTKPEVTPYDEFVMGRTPTAEQAWEAQGLSVYDRINRGYLGDVAAESAPKPFVAPQVEEYAGPRKMAPKELAPPPPKPVDTFGTGQRMPAEDIRPTRSAFREAEVPDIPTVENDISVVKSQLGILQDELKAGDYSGSTGKINLLDSIKKHKESLSVLEKRKAELAPTIEKGMFPDDNKFGLVPEEAPEAASEVNKAILSNERGSSPELADAARQIKEFFVPLSTIPQGEAYMALRYKDLLGGLTRVDRVIGQLSDRFKGLSITDKADVFNAIRGEIPINTLPVELQTVAKQTIADTNRVGKMLVRRGMLKQEVFDANKDNYIHYMYLRHILPDGENIPVGRGGRMDLSYLKARKDLPESVRQELGLIEDVSVAAPVGMGKALGDVVKADFFRKVASNPEWVWQPSMEIAKLTRELKAYKQIVERGENVGPDVVAKYRQLEEDLASKSAAVGKVPVDFIQLPDSKAYGDLQGAFVRKEIANDIMPVYSVNLGELEGLGRVWNKAGKAFDMGMTMFKVGKVALNPPTMIRNTFSNLIQMNMSGIPVNRVPGALVDGVQSIIAKDKYYRMMERYGGFKTNFSVAELGEVLKTFQDAKGSPITKFFGAVTDAAKYYGKIDDIAKMSLFKDAVTRQGMSVPDAAQYAQKWGMDYSLASRSVKHARRYVLPFASYQYKIAPLIAETLVKRPWVLAKYAAIPYLMAQSAAWKYDWTEKDLDKAQKLMLEKTKGQGAYMLIPVKDNKGNIEVVNMEYFLPWGNILEMTREVKGGNYIDAAKQFGGIAGPYGNIVAMLATKREGEPPKDPFTGQPVYSKLDSPQTKYLKQTEWWWKLFGPTSFSSTGALGYTYKAMTGEKDKWGVEATGMKAIGRWMGVNVGSIDPQSVMATRKARVRQLQEEMRRIMRDPQYGQQERQDALKRLQIEHNKIVNPE